MCNYYMVKREWFDYAKCVVHYHKYNTNLTNKKATNYELKNAKVGNMVSIGHLCNGKCHVCHSFLCVQKHLSIQGWKWSSKLQWERVGHCPLK